MFDFAINQVNHIWNLCHSDPKQPSRTKPVDVPLSVTNIISPKTGPSRTQQPSSMRPELSSVEFRAGQTKSIQDIENVRKNNQLLRYDSSESEVLMSARGSFADSQNYSHMEASGTIVPDETIGEIKSPPPPKPPSLAREAVSAPAALEKSTVDESLLLADFLATDYDFDTERNQVFRAIRMVMEVINYYTRVESDVQVASLLVLAVISLLPPTTSISEQETQYINNVFVDLLQSLGMSPFQVGAITSTHLRDLMKTGLNPFQIESILDSYHNQLHSLSLYNPATSLRRLSYPTFPAVYESALKDTHLGLVCQNCKNPLNNPRGKTICETCRRRQAPCPICWCKYPAIETAASRKKKPKSRRPSVRFSVGADLLSSSTGSVKPGATANANNITFHIPGQEHGADEQVSGDEPSQTIPDRFSSPQPVLWMWCPLCGHGGHTICMSSWFADTVNNLGACPTPGCLCDCIKGPRRDARIAWLEGLKKDKDKAKPVKGDDWKVGESKAVAALQRGSPGASAGAAAGEGPSSAALKLRRDSERERRVRVMEPAMAAAMTRRGI
jgi:WD repeat-containing protein 24